MEWRRPLLRYPVVFFCGWSLFCTLLWSAYLRNVLSARGPYTRRQMSNNSCELMSTAMRPFPDRHPSLSQFWTKKKPNSDVEEHNAFVLKLVFGGRGRPVAVAVYFALLFKILLFLKSALLSFAVETGNIASRLIYYSAESSTPKMVSYPSSQSHRL